MGYTHYWETEKTIPLNVWENIIRDCKFLAKKAKKLDVHINGCFTHKYAQFNNNLIKFNGGSGGERTKNDEGDWENDWENDKLSHETFALKRTSNSGSCKTARKPYDLMVCACLIVVKHYYPQFLVDSDGDLGDEEWQDAFKFVEQHLPGVQKKLFIDFTEYELSKAQ